MEDVLSQQVPNLLLISLGGFVVPLASISSTSTSFSAVLRSQVKT